MAAGGARPPLVRCYYGLLPGGLPYADELVGLGEKLPGLSFWPLELDPTVIVPALMDAFGERYGGYWIEVRESDDVMHVGVVGATPADAETVAQVTGRHPRVVTDPVDHGWSASHPITLVLAAAISRPSRNSLFTCGPSPR